MEEVDLRQFWGPEYRWEDSVPGMTEHEVVIEEVAMTAGVGRTEEREVSMRWALDSGASKHIASDPLLHPPQPCARGQQHQHVQRTPGCRRGGCGYVAADLPDLCGQHTHGYPAQHEGARSSRAPGESACRRGGTN